MMRKIRQTKLNEFVFDEEYWARFRDMLESMTPVLSDIYDPMDVI